MSTETNGHTKITLRFVGTADFRHNDSSQLDEVIKAVGKNLRPSECGILVSKGGKILRFVFGMVEHEMVNSAGRPTAGRVTKVVPSRTYRIVDGGTFNPYMLQNYANDLGIELAHLKRLEAHLKSQGVVEP